MRQNQPIIYILLLVLLKGAQTFAGTVAISGQHAGMIGKISLGAGYLFENKISLALYYGETPLELSNGRVRQYSLKGIYSPFDVRLSQKWHWETFYSGLLITYTDHPNYFMEPPHDKQPDNYYDPTALRYGIILGSEWTYHLPKTRDHNPIASIYLELVALDPEITVFLKNRDKYNGDDVFSAGLGFRYRF